MFKVNNKGIGVFMVNFEEVNAAIAVLALLTLSLPLHYFEHIFKMFNCISTFSSHVKLRQLVETNDIM